MSAIALLRAAVKDACDQCAACEGTGLHLLPGATVRCSRCASWRDALHVTHPRQRRWVRWLNVEWWPYTHKLW